MSHTYFKKFRGERQHSHQRKTSYFIERILKRNKKSGVFIAICYVKHSAIPQISRTAGGMFKIIAERLGKQYKFFIFPSDEKERIEIYYRGELMDKVQQDIYSAANMTFEQLINMHHEGFTKELTLAEQIRMNANDPIVKDLFNKLKK